MDQTPCPAPLEPRLHCGAVLRMERSQLQGRAGARGMFGDRLPGPFI